MAEVKLNFFDGEELNVTIRGESCDVLRIDEHNFQDIAQLVKICQRKAISLKNLIEVIAKDKLTPRFFDENEVACGDWYDCDGRHLGRGSRGERLRGREGRIRDYRRGGVRNDTHCERGYRDIRGSAVYQPKEPIERGYDNRRKQLQPDESSKDAFDIMLDNLAKQQGTTRSDIHGTTLTHEFGIPDLYVDTEGLKRLQMRVGGLQHLSELSVEELHENFSKDELENLLSTLLEYKQQLQDGDDGQIFIYYVTSEYGLPKDLPFDQLKNIYGWVTEAKSLKSFLDNYKDKTSTAFDVMRKRQELITQWLKDSGVDLVKIGLEEPIEVDEE